MGVLLHTTKLASKLAKINQSHITLCLITVLEGSPPLSQYLHVAFVTL